MLTDLSNMRLYNTPMQGGPGRQEIWEDGPHESPPAHSSGWASSLFHQVLHKQGTMESSAQGSQSSNNFLSRRSHRKSETLPNGTAQGAAHQNAVHHPPHALHSPHAPHHLAESLAETAHHVPQILAESVEVYPHHSSADGSEAAPQRREVSLDTWTSALDAAHEHAGLNPQVIDAGRIPEHQADSGVSCPPSPLPADTKTHSQNAKSYSSSQTNRSRNREINEQHVHEVLIEAQAVLEKADTRFTDDLYSQVSEVPDGRSPTDDEGQDGATRTYKNKALRAVSTNRDVQGGFCQRFVNGHTFEVLSAVLIVTNTLVMAFEAEYKGMESGHALGHQDFTRRAADDWPGASIAFRFLDVFFTTAFSAELLIRIWAWKLRAFTNFWVILDSLVIFGSLTESVGLWPFDTSTLRLVRLLRIVRVLRVAQAINAFDTLFLLVKSLVASVGALFWSFVVLLLLQLAVGMLLSQILHEYINDTSEPKEVRLQAFYYFGTFSKMVLTMFEITFANWVPSCRFFVDNVSGYFTLFYILYRNMICFAVIRVIAAIFICETNRIAAADLDLQVRRQARMKEQQVRKLKDVFIELDTSGDGQLDRPEFARVLKDDLLQAYLRTVEVEADDLHDLFDALDKGDGVIPIEDFMSGIHKNRRGPARAVDIISLNTKVTKLIDKLEERGELQASKENSREPGSPMSPGRSQSRSRASESFRAKSASGDGRKLEDPSLQIAAGDNISFEI